MLTLCRRKNYFTGSNKYVLISFFCNCYSFWLSRHTQPDELCVEFVIWILWLNGWARVLRQFEIGCPKTGYASTRLRLKLSGWGQASDWRSAPPLLSSFPVASSSLHRRSTILVSSLIPRCPSPTTPLGWLADATTTYVRFAASDDLSRSTRATRWFVLLFSHGWTTVTVCWVELLGFLSLSWTEWWDLPLVSCFSCLDGAALHLQSTIDCTGWMSPRGSSSNSVFWLDAAWMDRRRCTSVVSSLRSPSFHLVLICGPLLLGTLLFLDLPARLSASGLSPSPHPGSGTLCHHLWNLMTAPYQLSGTN